MSKLQERLPGIAKQEVIPITRSVVDDVIDNGRVETEELLQAIQKRLADEQLGDDIILREARKSIAQQFVSAWANAATIRLDRKQRVPVYQLDIGFKESYFKVGSTYVLPEAMAPRDFEIMLERIDHRIDNAQTDRAILADFYGVARPGLEAGQNLVEQFDAGVFSSFLGAASTATAAIEEGGQEGVDDE